MKYALLSLFVLTSVAETQAESPNPSKELALGRSITAELDRSSPPIEDARMSAYLTNLADRLNRRAHSPFPLKIALTREATSPFVHGLPGGFLRVPLGVILGAASERDLAFALAHGIAHVVAKHGFKRQQNDGIANVPLIYLGGWLHLHDESLLPRAMLAAYRREEEEANQLAEAWIIGLLEPNSGGEFDAAKQVAQAIADAASSKWKDPPTLRRSSEGKR